MFESKGGTDEALTKDFILSRISEEDIFTKYLNIRPNTYDYFRNPLRQDKHADCRFYRDGRGVLKFKDFAYKLNIDCFNVVTLVVPTATNYGLALKQIAEDFGLYKQSINYEVVQNWEQQVEKAAKKLCKIQVKRKEFTQQEINWWSEQGISEKTLSFYKVSSLQYLWLNDSLIYQYSKKDPGYVYYFNNYDYKAYFPLRTDYRFIQNIDKTTLQGFEQLPEGGLFLVITKSLKDVLCMSEYDIPAIAPTSESVLIEEKIFSELADRFFYIFTLFDRDYAGVTLTQQMRKKYNTIPLLFDRGEPKDFTDNRKHYGSWYMSDLIEEVKKDYL